MPEASASYKRMRIVLTLVASLSMITTYIYGAV
jgi:hypothetical protein